LLEKPEECVDELSMSGNVSVILILSPFVLSRVEGLRKLFQQPVRVKRLLIGLWFFCLAACAGQTHTAEAWRCAAQDTRCPLVFIVHDSWHAAIVLRRADLGAGAIPETSDFPGARHIEFSWGDKDYFPDPNSGVLKALKAAFWSSGSVLHLVGFDDDVGKFFPKAEVVELRLSALAYDRLIAFISASFARAPEGGRAAAQPGLYEYSRFYPSTRSFSLLNTCNTWVARALETAGLPVTASGVISAGQLGDQLRGIAPPAASEN
jgi:uncharacterized protein (TIGR02117 family)